MVDDKGLISVRGLVDADFGTPLRRFYGKLHSYAADTESKYGTRVVLNFADVDVVESEEPYMFPTATISIKLSNRKNSAWGIYAASLAACIPESEDIKDQIGKKIGMVLTSGHKFGKDAEGKEIERPCWEVFEVAGMVKGAAHANPVEELKKLLDGKTLVEFNTAAYTNPMVRASADLQRAITDQSFVRALLQTGEFVKDELGIHRKK